MADKTRAEELFDEFKKKALEDEKSGTENFDKNLLTFSSGALGLSLAFIEDIVPLSMAHWVACLFISWIAFTLCIIVTMASFQMSIRALRESIPFGEAYYLREEKNAFNEHLRTFCCRAVDWCTWIGSALFVTGLVCTIIFVCANVVEAKRMGKKDEISQKMIRTTDGLKPAAMTPISSDAESQPREMARKDKTAGLKPGPMTPAPKQGPAQPAPGNTPAKD